MNERNSKLELTRSGVFIRTPAGTRKKVAATIRLRAIGERKRDKITLAQIRFETMRGAILDEFFEFSNLLPENWRKIKWRLADLGYEWPEDKELAQSILSAIAKTRPKCSFIVVPAPGWYEARFVIRNVAFAPRREKIRIHIDPGSNAHVASFVLGEGTLRDWQEKVAAPSRKSSRLRVSIAAAFAAPLLRPLGFDSFGINWFSDTSDGKTLALIVAASVAGLYGPQGLPCWGDSESGLEGLAYGHRDQVLPLDESADGEHQMPLEKKARMLAFLIARNRPRKVSWTYERAHNLDQREYRIILLSSSERALRQIARAAGGKRLGGEEVRFLDIAASEHGSAGIFDGHIKPATGRTPRETTKDLVERLKGAATKYQGHAFRAFFEKYMNDESALEKVKRYKQEFESKATLPDRHNAHYRIRSNFALLYAAAALAIDYEILPWGKRSTFRAIEKCMRLALAVLGTSQTQGGSTTSRCDLLRVGKALQRHLARGTILPVRPKQRVTAEQARARQKADGFKIKSKIYVKPDRLKSWLTAQSERNVLKAHKIIVSARTDTSTVERKIGGIKGKPRYYVIDLRCLYGLS